MPMYDNSDRRCNTEELDPCLAAEVRIKNDLMDIRQSKCLLCLLLSLLTAMLLIAAGIVLVYKEPLLKRFNDYPQLENPPSTMDSSSIFDVKLPLDMHYKLNNGKFDSKQSSHVHEVRILPKMDGPHKETFTTRYRYFAPVYLAAVIDFVDSFLTTTGTITATASLTTSISAFTTKASNTKPAIATTTTTTAAKMETTAPFLSSAANIIVSMGNVPSTTAGTVYNSSALNGKESGKKLPEIGLNFVNSSLADSSLTVFDYVTTSTSMQDCDDYRRAGYNKTGIYNISLNSIGNFRALCVMENNTSHAWITLHRRTSSRLPFWNATFAEYADGFGDTRGDHWLGLDRFHAFMKYNTNRSVILRIVLSGKRCVARKCNAEGYWWGDWEFSIGSREKFFDVTHIKFLTGNLSYAENDYFSMLSRNQKFTTVDADHDSNSSDNNAIRRGKGGWWHKDFTFTSLNGVYGANSKVGEGQSWYWANGKGETYYIKPTVSLMMFRIDE